MSWRKMIQATARELARPVEAVKADDPIHKVLHCLKKHRVAVLVDDSGRPVGIRTMTDVDHVSGVVARLGAESAGGESEAARASSLFPRIGTEAVISVRESEPIGEVAQKILARDYSTGIPVVDEQGVLKGYVYAEDAAQHLKAATRELGQQIQQREQSLRVEYGENWSAIQRRIQKF